VAYFLGHPVYPTWAYQNKVSRRTCSIICVIIMILDTAIHFERAVTFPRANRRK